ncbi:MAG: hypothetical protein ACKVQW_14080 [Pyrinomonadaceae bacterium]
MSASTRPVRTALTTAELKILDGLIDDRIQSFEMLRVRRRTALKLVLHAFDVLIQNLGTESHLAQRGLNYRGAYNGLNHAVRWIFEYCPEESSFVPENSDLSALELLTNASDYDKLFVQMSLARRGRNQIEHLDGQNYLIRPSNDENVRLEASRHLLAVVQHPETPEDTHALSSDDAERLKNSIKIKGVAQGQLRYEISDEDFQSAREIMDARKLHQWTMDPEWDLGGYTFEELRIFWNALKTQRAIDDLALQKLPRVHDRNRYNLRAATESQWVERVTKHSGLPQATVRSLFGDHIYNPALHRLGKKRGHVMFQPFFDIGGGLIIRSNALVMISAVEKCAWLLCELLRKDHHDRLKNKKESYWIGNDFRPYESDTRKLFPHLKFKEGDRSGDIDLLMVDLDDAFGLVCQLKWTTSSDNVAGVESDDKQFGVGVEQAERSVAWARDNRKELARRIQIDEAVLAVMELQPLVIGKDMLPSGTFGERAVPVINEALLTWILDAPHKRSLRDLWTVSVNRGYLPEEGVHFKRHTPEPMTWGQLTFTFEDVGYLPLQRWNPDTDIRFPPRSGG